MLASVFMRKIAIFGASSGGKLLYDAIKIHRDKWFLWAFYDNKESLAGKIVSGVKVRGDLSVALEDISRGAFDELIIAISEIDPQELKELSVACNQSGCALRVIPQSIEIALTDSVIGQLRKPSINDLLRRMPIKFDVESLASQVADKAILVTGAAGSIGSEIVRQILRLEPKKIIALDWDENELYLLELYCKRHSTKTEFESVLGSIQDEKAMNSTVAKFRPEIVFHCAAHKHVPMMEKYPEEAIRNNIIGTINVLNAAKEYGAKQFTLISTDKAVRPTNVMGATKRIAERIVLSCSSADMRCSAVRFGNVLGSAGSVVPIFQQLLDEGRDLTVTDERMTRYFMTIPEASCLVIETSFMSEGGELFILDMGEPVRIVDLAETLIELTGSKAKIRFTGARPGEKLYEELFYDMSSVERTANPKVMLSKHSSSPLSVEQILSEIGKIDELDSLYRFLGTYADGFKPNI